ncbi:MBL fold metallo-hydrolase [Nocardia jiangxiensis]|uniref:MBL fold metallo-hydrolase n=1 Tax=Nocardia jiangxiensis TaxID=282685 RepID=UPI00030536FD|nr:MBL fold metallo-hydrolase [Nocardia jiangxiensis]
MALRIGRAQIERVAEQHFSVPFTLLTEDRDFIARRISPLPGGFLDPAAMTFEFSCHSWIIRVDSRTVLVDPCNGNGRTRGVPQFDDSDFPYLERLAEIGVPAESIDIVFCTHLHNDHCGWNTMLRKGKWVPTFPNATYLFVDSEYRRWDTARAEPHPNDFNVSVFDECVRPIVESGRAEIVAATHSISASLSLDPATGHTEGHTMLCLTSEGEHAYFTGDVLHHPAQVSRPELHLGGCDNLETAIATRRSVCQRISEENALIFPAHFSAPHYGRITHEADEYVFVPAGARGSLGTGVIRVLSG